MPRPGSHVIHPRVLDAPRRISEAGMTDTCEVRQPDVVGALDPATGEQTTTPGALVYSGACRVHPVPLNERQVIVGEEVVVLSRYYLRLPAETSGINVDQVVTITAVDADRSTSNLVGRRWRVVDHTPRVFATDLRVTIKEEGAP